MISRFAIPGLIHIEHASFKDERGLFNKLFHPDDLGLGAMQAFGVRESFMSWSEPGVLRGMHYQTPPFAHAKTVSCLAGVVLDVVLDLRRNSPSYGEAVGVQLDGIKPSTLWIPAGCAHGFAVLGPNPALMHYLVTAEHSPAHDCGVRWDSFGFKWPSEVAKVISSRDQALPLFCETRPET